MSEFATGAYQLVFNSWGKSYRDGFPTLMDAIEAAYDLNNRGDGDSKYIVAPDGSIAVDETTLYQARMVMDEIRESADFRRVLRLMLDTYEARSKGAKPEENGSR